MAKFVFDAPKITISDEPLEELLGSDWKSRELEAEEKLNQIEEELKHEEYKRNLEWHKSNYVRRFSRARNNSPRKKVIFRPKDEERDIASIQHRRISDE